MASKQNELSTFEWKGVNRRGEVVQGFQQAKSIAIVKAELRKQGIVSKKIHKKRYTRKQPNKKSQKSRVSRKS